MYFDQAQFYQSIVKESNQELRDYFQISDYIFFARLHLLLIILAWNVQPLTRKHVSKNLEEL